MTTFVAMDLNKTSPGGVKLHKFPNEMKDSRLQIVSMLWSSPTNSQNILIYRL